MSQDRTLNSRVSGHLSEWYCSACPWSVVVSGDEHPLPEDDVRELFNGHICTHNQKKSGEAAHPSTREKLTGS